MKGYIKRLFERRQFTTEERGDMQDLYKHAELFAQRMAVTVPHCSQLEQALQELKGVLALCETAVALNPKHDEKQMAFTEAANAEFAAKCERGHLQNGERIDPMRGVRHRQGQSDF